VTQFSSLGSRIRYLRSSNGISTRQLAEKAGCSRTCLWKIEKDQVCPSFAILQRIGRVLGLPVSDIVRLDPVLPQPQFIDLDATDRPLAMLWHGARLTHILPDYQTHGITGLLLSLEVGASTPPRRARRPINKLCVVLRGKVRFSTKDTSIDLKTSQVLYYTMNVFHEWTNIGDEPVQVLMVHPYTFRLFEQEEEDLAWERRTRVPRKKKGDPRDN
jgi:transcriptional regulator with XRE-family HTH domain